MSRATVFPMLKPIQKSSVADAVYQQLRDAILDGEFAPETVLPPERALAELMHVNRGAVREALKRLEQGRLVATEPAGTRVLDFRVSARLDLISQLLFTRTGELDLDVARSLIELRSAISPEIARYAALRIEPEAARQLQGLCEQMRAASTDVERLQELSQEFWDLLAAASGNIAFVLIFNTVREAHERYSRRLRSVVAAQYLDVASFEAIAGAIVRGDADDAWRQAKRHATPISGKLSEEISALQEAEPPGSPGVPAPDAPTGRTERATGAGRGRPR